MGIKNHTIKAVKIAFGCGFAIIAAKIFKLEYATSCGIITLLTIQDTKMDTLRLSLQRILSFAMSMAIAYIICLIPTHHTFQFFIYLLFVVEISYIMRWNSSISTNAVFGTHIFFSENTVTEVFVENEFSLLVIGMVIAIIMNWKMPNMEIDIKQQMKHTETELKKIFSDFTDMLGGIKKPEGIQAAIEELTEYIECAIDKSVKNKDNTLAEHSDFYIGYFVMRKNQCGIIGHLVRSVGESVIDFESLTDFITDMAGTISAKNGADYRIEQLAKVTAEFEQLPMPENKAEFEMRSMVFFVIKEIEEFLRLKQRFYNDLSLEQKSLYLDI